MQSNETAFWSLFISNADLGSAYLRATLLYMKRSILSMGILKLIKNERFPSFEGIRRGRTTMASGTRGIAGATSSHPTHQKKEMRYIVDVEWGAAWKLAKRQPSVSRTENMPNTIYRLFRQNKINDLANFKIS